MATAPDHGAATKGRIMVNARAIARLATLAVGLGIGMAVAAIPGVAVADSSADWLGDLFADAALPAPVDPGLNLAISIDGYSLLSDGTASADSGSGDVAIAFGDGAYASAEGGTGDFALADGTDALAQSGGLSTDAGANDDTAIDIGNNSGPDDAAWAGNSDLNGGSDGGTGSGDTAIDIGNNSGFFDGSVSGADGLVGGTDGGTGNDDIAIDVGNNTGDVDGPWTVAGNDNFAISLGNDTIVGEGAIASNGNSNIAEGIGTNTYAYADTGNSNIAFVFNPFGTDESDAYAGFPGNSDLSAVFGDGLQSTSATGGDYLYDILSPAGDLPGTAAATSGGLLAELLSLF
jgi:hypothetical protein